MTESEKQTLAVKMYELLKDPPVMTWSANMPAYAYTDLCQDQELREWPERKEWQKE